ncbi:hypothetical protein LWI29_001204 [Acer saccharum]|uniref:Uncharacterized protein n=1 Tax=Acer saccharum TaxID=4024 RepID=A0AA39SN15_ACESA|nr:hypothetical protein LWI29_001204 [Acer saccharum]
MHLLLEFMNDAAADIAFEYLEQRDHCKAGRLVMHGLTGTPPSNSNLMENWVICRIFLKKRSMREDADHNGVVGDQPGRFHDFMTRDNNIRLSPEISSCSSSSSSSGTYQ